MECAYKYKDTSCFCRCFIWNNINDLNSPSFNYHKNLGCHRHLNLYHHCMNLHETKYCIYYHNYVDIARKISCILYLKVRNLITSRINIEINVTNNNLLPDGGISAVKFSSVLLWLRNMHKTYNKGLNETLITFIAMKSVWLFCCFRGTKEAMQEKKVGRSLC